MRIGSRRLGVLAVSAMFVIGWGCGSRPAVDTTTAEATVTGKVTIRGKPATGQTIAFDPSNVERKFEAARLAEIADDGSYSVTTLLGQNQVSFTGPVILSDPDLQYESLSFDVKRGENTLDIDLPTDQSANP